MIVISTFLLFRYRKQMEEMQRAFNKTIIKLQNTSRIAQEQVSPRGTSCEPDQVRRKQRPMSLFFCVF